MKPLSLNAFEWDLLKAALDKANGRVIIARRKVTALRKEQDDTLARAKAIEGTDVGSMEVDVDAKKDDPPAVEHPALTSALKAFASLTRGQKSTLSATLDGFISCLAPSPSSENPNPSSRKVLAESAWQTRHEWTGEDWDAWETWGWYRHFCRAYSPYLCDYSTTLSTVSFSKLQGSSDPAAEYIQKVWNAAIGQDS